MTTSASAVRTSRSRSHRRHLLPTQPVTQPSHPFPPWLSLSSADSPESAPPLPLLPCPSLSCSSLHCTHRVRVLCPIICGSKCLSRPVSVNQFSSQAVRTGIQDIVEKEESVWLNNTRNDNAFERLQSGSCSSHGDATAFGQGRGRGRGLCRQLSRVSAVCRYSSDIRSIIVTACQ